MISLAERPSTESVPVQTQTPVLRPDADTSAAPTTAAALPTNSAVPAAPAVHGFERWALETLIALARRAQARLARPGLDRDEIRRRHDAAVRLRARQHRDQLLAMRVR